MLNCQLYVVMKIATPVMQPPRLADVVSLNTARGQQRSNNSIFQEDTDIMVNL